MHKLDNTYYAHGFTLDVRVSPCSWMYPGYGLQFEFTSSDGRAHGFLHNRKVNLAGAYANDVEEMLEAMLKPVTCTVCENRTLWYGKSNRFDDTPERNPMCEPCFMAKITAELDQLVAKDREKIARRDRRMIKKGFAYRVTAWVHPKRGDDYPIEEYFTDQPTVAEIEAELRKRRSQILTDYTIVDIRPKEGSSD